MARHQAAEREKSVSVLASLLPFLSVLYSEFIFAYFALFLSADMFCIERKLVAPWFAAYAADILLAIIAVLFALRRLMEFSFRRALGIRKG